MMCRWVVLILLLGSWVGATKAEETKPAIVMSATGSVSRAPDRAVVRLAVETVAKTAVEATKENANKMANILKSLTKVAIPKQAVRTISYDLSPRYDQSDRRNTDPEPIGYLAQNMVEVVVDDFDKTGTVIDVAIQAGGNRVAGVQFEIKNYEGAYLEALQNAVVSARVRAEVVANASGYTLGEPQEINVSSYHPGPVFKAARAEAMMMADTPIEGGQIDVTAQVTVRYGFGALLLDKEK